MAYAHSRKNRCAVLLAALNEEHNWRLSPEAQQRYVDRITAIVGADELADDDLAQIIIRYHHDHDLVESLKDERHHLHGEHMRAWVAHTLRILRRNGLSWSHDAAVDSDDLVQIACTELARALPSFQYGSRFSTWANQVIIFSVQRYLRDSRAKKRGQRPDSIDQGGGLSVPASRRDDPESLGDASVLRALINDVLCKHSDRRLVHIFQMWQDEDKTVTEIGRELRISPQRARALLAITLNELRRSPDLLAWLAEQHEESL